jgi:hypothetical protein
MAGAGSLLSPSGRLRPLPFFNAAVVVYLCGVGSHLLTTSPILDRLGLWPFIAVQFALVCIWFVLHAQRLHDAGRGSDLALGVALIYVLSVGFLLIVGESFLSNSSGLLGDASATSALWLILILDVAAILHESSAYDLTWVVIAILSAAAILPIIVSLIFTIWAATRPSVDAS